MNVTVGIMLILWGILTVLFIIEKTKGKKKPYTFDFWLPITSYNDDCLLKENENKYITILNANEFFHKIEGVDADLRVAIQLPKNIDIFVPNFSIKDSYSPTKLKNKEKLKSDEGYIYLEVSEKTKDLIAAALSQKKKAFIKNSIEKAIMKALSKKIYVR